MIVVSVVITEVVPHGPAAIFGATKQQVVLEFGVTVPTLDDVEDRVADLIRSGLAVHPSKQIPDALGRPENRIGAGYEAPITDPVPSREDVVSRTDLRGPLMGDGSDLPPGGKHSGNCRCSACAEPDEVVTMKTSPVRDVPQA